MMRWLPHEAMAALTSAKRPDQTAQGVTLPTRIERPARTRRAGNVEGIDGISVEGIGSIEGIDRIEGIAPWRWALDRAITRALDTISASFVRHWLLMVNLLLAAIVGLALLDPMLFALGWSDLGSRMFAAYHLICEQIPSHSYFVFGYQLALCARNLAIYGSLLGGTLAFHAVRDRLPALDWRLWLLTLLPMALDGGTQLFGWRESTWELRTLTGILFGLGVCWFVLPRLAAAARGDTTAARVVVDLRAVRRLVVDWLQPAQARVRT